MELALPSLDGVEVISMRSVGYERPDGSDVLVVAGEAENRSGKERSNLFVVAELRDSEERVVARSRAPIGLPLSPGDLSTLTTTDSVEAVFTSRATHDGSRVLAAGSKSPYTIVFLQPPAHAAVLEHRIKLERGEVEPVVEPEPVPDPVEPAVPPKKGKRKGKRKKKQKRLWSDVGKKRQDEIEPESFSNERQVGTLEYSNGGICKLQTPQLSSANYNLTYSNQVAVIGLTIPSHRRHTGPGCRRKLISSY